MPLGTKTYTTVIWTLGDIATETKMDNMVDNDQAYDSHANEGLLFNNNKGISIKDSGGTNREVFNVDASNILTIGNSNLSAIDFLPNNNYMARAFLGSNQAITHGAGATKLQMNSETYDYNNNYDTANYRYTAPVKGIYEVGLLVHGINVQAGGKLTGAIYMNGVAVANSSNIAQASTDDFSVTVVEKRQINTGQYIEAYASFDNGSGTDDIFGDSKWTYMIIRFIKHVA